MCLLQGDYSFIREYYPEKPQVEIMRLLPMHTWNTIGMRVHILFVLARP